MNSGARHTESGIGWERLGTARETADSSLSSFKGRNSGVNLPADKDIGKKRPIDYFQLYITKDVTDQWVQNTNSSGKALAKGITWRYITLSEILALVMFFGVVKYPERGMAWDWDPKYGIDTLSRVQG